MSDLPEGLEEWRSKELPNITAPEDIELLVMAYRAGIAQGRREQVEQEYETKDMLIFAQQVVIDDLNGKIAGEVCDTCNQLERAKCFNQKDRLRTKFEARALENAHVAKERDELKQAIRNTLGTGMDRYIREAINYE